MIQYLKDSLMVDEYSVKRNKKVKIINRSITDEDGRNNKGNHFKWTKE